MATKQRPQRLRSWTSAPHCSQQLPNNQSKSTLLQKKQTIPHN